MNWIHPLYLLALPLFLVPILLHWLSKRPARVVYFPPFDLLLRATANESRRSVLRERLLMMLRMAFLLTLILALARPLITQPGTPGAERNPIDRIVILDNSLSMGVRKDGRSLLDGAKKVARSLIHRSGTRDRIAVEPLVGPLIDDGTETVGLTDDRERLLRQIEAIQLTYEPGTLIRKVGPWREPTPNRKREIWFLTDGTERPWGEFDMSAPNLHAVDLSEGKIPLNYILGTPLIREQQLHLRVEANQPRKGTTELLLERWDGANWLAESRRFLEFQGGTSVEVTLPLEIPAKDPRMGRVRIEGDDLSLDDESYFVHLPPQEISVLLVNGGQHPEPRLDAAYFLLSALRAANSSGESFVVSEIAPEKLPSESFDAYDVIALVDCGLLPSDQIDRFQRRLAQGVLISVGESFLSSPSLSAWEELLPVRLHGGQSAPPGSPYRIRPPDGAIFPTLQNRWGEWIGRAEVKKVILVEPRDRAERWLTFQGGVPALVVRREVHLRQALFTTTLGSGWGNLPLMSGYPTLIRSLVADLAGTRITDRRIPVFRRPVGGSVDELAWRLPSTPGVWRRDRAVAVTETDRGESELARLSSNQKVNWKLPTAVADLSSEGAGKKEGEMAGLGLLLVLLLIAESVLASRLRLWILLFALLASHAPTASAMGERSELRVARVSLPSSPGVADSRSLARILRKAVSMTNIEASESMASLRLDDPRLFDYPFLYWPGDRAFPLPSSEDLETLRRYLHSGGFVFFDDALGVRSGPFETSIRDLCRALFPARELSPLPRNHSIYRSFFLLDRAWGRQKNEGILWGLDLGKRTAAIYFAGDLAGAVREEVEGEESQRDLAIRFGVNLLMYALTLDYKQDQIHLPFILRRGR